MVECTKFRSYEKGTLIGFADLYIEKWGVDFLGCSVHRKDGKVWVNLPQKQWDDVGEVKWFPIAKFRDKDVSQAFSKQALEAIKIWRLQNESPSALMPPKQDYSDTVPF